MTEFDWERIRSSFPIVNSVIFDGSDIYKTRYPKMEMLVIYGIEIVIIPMYK